MAEHLEELRPFVVGRHTTLAWRQAQLETLRQALSDEKDAIIEALRADLCIDACQASFMQLSSLFPELDHYLDSMEEWSAPNAVPTPAALHPASSSVELQPKGVVLVLGAWNYPFNVTIGPAMTALAAGNCIVVKPSELSPASAKVMERILGRLDPRAVRCVTGGPELSSALVAQPFDHIVYTGGPRVAKLVLAAAAPNLTPVTLELGGKSPVVITKGVNLAEACRRIIAHKFINTGQTCIAPDYVLVERSVSSEVAKLLVACAEKTFAGGPESVEHFGRMVHAGAAERLRGALGEDHGGKVIFGSTDGSAPPADKVREGHRYVPPTIILDPSPSSRILDEELFGPVLPVLTVESADEAVAHVNSKPKPLALYVFAPPAIEKRVIESTSSGAVVSGDLVIHKGNSHLPFGGIGGSGMGRMHGLFGFRELSNQRAVMRRPLCIPSPITLPLDKNLTSLVWIYATYRPSRMLPAIVRKALGHKALRYAVYLMAALWTWGRLKRRLGLR